MKPSVALPILALLLAAIFVDASVAVCEHSASPSHEKSCAICALGRMPCGEPSPAPSLQPQAEELGVLCPVRVSWPFIAPVPARSGRSPPLLSSPVS